MKVFFFDVDGTLLDANQKIYEPSKKTKFAVAQLKKAGHKVILASGRPRCILSDELKSLDFDGYITSNGAELRIDEELIYQITLDQNLVSGLLENEDKYHYEVVFESEQYLHGNHINDGEFNSLIDKYHLPREIVINDFNYDLYKAQILFKKHEFKPAYFEGVNQIIKDNSLLPYEKYYFDVYNKNINKGVGVKKVKAFFGLDEDSYYAFGDELNDYEMMKNVNNSICMGNGNDKIKKICKYTTKNVEEEGIYYFLKKNNII